MTIELPASTLEHTPEVIDSRLPSYMLISTVSNSPIPKCAAYPTTIDPCTASGNSIRNPYLALPASLPSPFLLS